MYRINTPFWSNPNRTAFCMTTHTDTITFPLPLENLNSCMLHIRSLTRDVIRRLVTSYLLALATLSFSALKPPSLEFSALGKQLLTLFFRFRNGCCFRLSLVVCDYFLCIKREKKENRFKIFKK